MKLSSEAFNNGESIPAKYTCDGDDISPPLNIENVPVGTKSLGLIVDDPDAPGGDFLHWTIWNIPPETIRIAEGVAPAGVEGVTDFGRSGWGGPCPPSGIHNYVFTLYALDTKLDLPNTVGRREIEKVMAGHVIEEVKLIGKYQR